MVKERIQPFGLIILDGWGISRHKRGNAVRLAQTPYFDRLFRDYPHTTMQASGEAVGLPQGQIGNSEAGHMNIGAGRVITQDATLVNNSIEDKTFFKNPAFRHVVHCVVSSKSHLHLMGLLTGIQSAHADRRHLFALLDFFKGAGVKQVYLHLFTDGRDSPPNSGIKHLRLLQKKIRDIGLGEIVTIIGRYYAMDRIRKWERIEKAYNNLTLGEGKKFSNPEQALKYYYDQGITDEFIPPTAVSRSKPAFICENDGVVFFNLRSDRGREITEALTQPDFVGFERKKKFRNLYFITMTEFGPYLRNAITAYPARLYNDTLPVVIGEYSQFKQLYIAESEKYPHITYFLNGGFDRAVDFETRVKIPSPKVKSYVEKPEMHADKVTDVILKSLKESSHNFIVVNYANPDMVGHTGSVRAAIRALEFLDTELKRLLDEFKRRKGVVFIIADHGNVEEMIDLQTGSILTSHTDNPVPFILVDFGKRTSQIKLAKGGKLANITPTILDYLGLEKPKTMTEESLIIRNSQK